MSRSWIQVLYRGAYSSEEQIGPHSYAVKDRQGRSCVLKLLCSDKVESWESQAYFEGQLRQLKSLDAVNHPQLARLLTIAEDEYEGQYAQSFVRSYIPGRTLQEWQARRTLTPGEIWTIINNTLDILIDLQKYSPPIVHGDLQSERIVLDDEMNCFFLPGPGRMTLDTPALEDADHAQASAPARPAQDIQDLARCLRPFYEKNFVTYGPLKRWLHGVPELDAWFKRACAGQFSSAQEAKARLNRAPWSTRLKQRLRRQFDTQLKQRPRLVAAGLLMVGALSLWALVGGEQNASDEKPLQQQSQKSDPSAAPNSKLSQKYEYLKPQQLAMPSPWERVPYRNNMIYDVVESERAFWVLSPLKIWRLPDNLKFPQRYRYWPIRLFKAQTRSYVKGFAATDSAVFAASTGESGFLSVWKDGEWQQLELPFKDTRINDMQAISHQGRLILGLKHQLWQYDPQLGNWDLLAQMPPQFKWKRIRSLLSASDGSIWLVHGRKILRYQAKKLTEEFKSPINIDRLALGPAGRLWAAGERKVLSFQKGQKPQTLHQTLWAEDLQGDPQQGLWIASRKQGLHYYSPQDKRWRSWKRDRGLPSQKLKSLYLDSQDRLWVGSDDAGLWFAPRQALLEQPAVSSKNLALKEADCICTLVQTELNDFDSGDVGKLGLKKRTQVYLQGRQVYPSRYGNHPGYKRQGDKVVYRFQSKIHVWNGSEWMPLEWPGKRGQSIHESLYDRQGRVWVQTSGGQTFVYAQGLWHLLLSDTRYRHASFHEAPDGRVWIGRSGGFDSALYSFEPTPLSANDLPAQRLKAELLPQIKISGVPKSFSIRQIRSDAQGGLWFSNGAELWHRPRPGAPWQHWGAKAGQPLDVIYDLRPEDGGAVWLAGRGGLAYFKQGHFDHWDSRIGLSDEIEALGLDAQGRLWTTDRDNRAAIYRPQDLWEVRN